MKRKTYCYFTCMALISLCVLLAIPASAFASEDRANEFANAGDEIVPFLHPPYVGQAEIGSIFDHDQPCGTVEGTEDCPANVNTVVHYNGTETAEGTNGALGSYSGHAGIDYDMGYKPILAAADGTVRYAGWESPTLHNGEKAGMGLYIAIEHEYNNRVYYTRYGHMSSVAVRADGGAESRVKAGYSLGLSGSQGDSSGPHLHFEVRMNERYCRQVWHLG